VLTSSLIFSCKKDNNSTSSDTTNNTNINSKCKNEVITRNDSILITGCSDFETSLIFITGGYLLSMSEKTDNSLTAFEVYQTAFSTYQNVRAYSASALRPDGWYSQDGIWEHLEGVWKWRVKATDSYRIIFTKLPLSKTPASLPVTYNSAGRSVIGPFRLSGSTTFTITCPDAKLAGFTAELFDATGAEILENYANILDVINIDANNNQINNYSKVITKQLSEGNYLMRVSANKNATWTVSIN
jgi:hypothetical protein